MCVCLCSRAPFFFVLDHPSVADTLREDQAQQKLHLLCNDHSTWIVNMLHKRAAKC